VLFLFCCIVLTAFVLVPEIWGHGKTKDYPLWYWAGQQVLHALNLYRTDGQPFDFIYPPLSAVLLAIAAGLLVLAVLPTLRAKRDEVFVESEG